MHADNVAACERAAAGLAINDFEREMILQSARKHQRLKR